MEPGCEKCVNGFDKIGLPLNDVVFVGAFYW